jgi:serine/threonine protein kinase
MNLENSLVLGRYRVLWQVDQKKLVKTYIARDEQREELGSPVLIKHFMHDLAAPESSTKSTLFEELTALEQLRSPGVVSLLSHGMLQNTLVTAHAHMPGIPLTRLCEAFGRRQQLFPSHLAVYIVRCLLRTLQQCHTRPGRAFLHGRITLGCIHLPSVGEPQLADFGLASLEDAAAEEESRLGFFQTRMSYAAPEITRGGVPSVQGDTYSLGLLLYRLLAGTNPFRGRSIPETLQRVLRHTPAELHMPAWEYCGDTNAILMRALSKDPERRYQTSKELYAALCAVQGASDQSLAPELSNVVRSNGSADWAQIARLTRAVRRSRPPQPSGGIEHASASLQPESAAPAFVSGLLTEQPHSVSEHTLEDQSEQQARRERRPRRPWAILPTVLIPAVAIICGLFLGRLGGARATAGAARRAQDEAGELVNGSVRELRTRLRRCAAARGKGVPDAKIELDFGTGGDLAQVRLSPHELGQTRFGACLLETVWESKLSAPSAVSLVIPLTQP